MSNSSQTPANEPVSKPAPAPLPPEAQAALDEARAQVADMPDHLFTPHLWAQQALNEMVPLMGSPQAMIKLAEARRYLACDEAMRRLALRVFELQEKLRASAPAADTQADGNSRHSGPAIDLG